MIPKSLHPQRGPQISAAGVHRLAIPKASAEHGTQHPTGKEAQDGLLSRDGKWQLLLS